MLVVALAWVGRYLLLLLKLLSVLCTDLRTVALAASAGSRDQVVAKRGRKNLNRHAHLPVEGQVCPQIHEQIHHVSSRFCRRCQYPSLVMLQGAQW